MILSVLLIAVAMSAMGFLGMAQSTTSSLTFFYVTQVFSIGLGSLICYLLTNNFFGELAYEKLNKVLLVFAITTAGMAGFTLIFDHFSTSDLAPYYSASLITFIIPQCLAVCLETFINIPQEIYKIWYFPFEEREVDFDKIDTSNVFVLELEFSKSVNDNSLVNSKAKAPLGMLFGDWFMSFIENYNQKFDRDPIQYLNSDNMPDGWIFYVKPSFLGVPRYIDPDVSIKENKISEKNVIIAKRAGSI